MYDAARRRFIAFTKRGTFCPNGTGDQGTGIRTRSIAFSSDFENWTAPVDCLIPDDQDARDVNFYRMNGWPYEGMYLGELEIYYSDYRREDKPLMRETQLVSSRDGERWWRAGNRRTFMPCGSDGSWDGKMIDVNSNGPIPVGDELWIYYGGRNYPHNSHPEFFPWEGEQTASIGLAKLRRDGFVSYDAAEPTGTLLTKPLQFEAGRRLHVNADASSGHVRVEVLPASEREDAPIGFPPWRLVYGGPVPGYTLDDAVPVSGDHLDAVVSWKGGSDFSRFAGEWIALRFSMENASLYSFWVD
jgi:hypothetical protein